MMLNKRASVEGVIKWIFVLIAGTIIAFFFMHVYNNYKATAEREAMIDITMKLNNILANAQGNPNTIFPLQIRDVTLHYDDCQEGIYLNNNRNLRIQLSALFAPSDMDSLTGEYFLFVLPFSFPFRIDNVVFLTNPDIAYIFFQNQSNTNSIIPYLFDKNKGFSFPKRLTHFIITYNHTNDVGLEKGLQSKFNVVLQDLAHQNFDEVYFIFDSNDYPSSPLSLTSVDLGDMRLYVRLLQRIPNTPLGIADFSHLEKQSGYYQMISDGRVSFLEKATLFGTLFTETPQLYNCTFRKLLQRYEYLLQEYTERCMYLEMVFNDFVYQGVPVSCKDPYVYTACINTFGSLQTALETYFAHYPATDVYSDLGTLYDLSYVTYFQNDVDTFSLKHLNEVYAQNQDCPLIY